MRVERNGVPAPRTWGTRTGMAPSAVRMAPPS